MSVEVSMTGMEELMQRLEEMGNKAGKIQNEALKRAAETVLDSAKEKVPVDTGKLKDTLDMSTVKTKNGEKYIEVGITKGDNSEIFYGKFIEWGTSQRPATPYLQPAYEENQNKIKEIIKQELKEGLGI
jgi:HK97 gp10 family phage protein